MELQNNNESLLRIRETKNVTLNLYGISDTSEEQKWVVGVGRGVGQGWLLKGTITPRIKCKSVKMMQ